MSNKLAFSQIKASHLVLPVFVIASLLLYGTTSNYGIVTDYLGWLERYKEGSWSGILDCFGYPGLHQFFHSINYTTYKVIGPSLVGLYFVFALSHSLASFSVYKFLTYLGRSLGAKESKITALFAALLFLTSPYAAEVITWKACLHYMLITILFSWSAISYIKYVEEGTLTSLLHHMTLFILGLFTLEIGLVTPGIFGVIGLGLFATSKGGTKQIIRVFKTAGIHALSLLGYLYLTKVFIGQWIGHYGAEKHTNFEISLVLSNLSKYVAKYYSYTHYWPQTAKLQIYRCCESPIIHWLLGISIIGLLIYAIWKGMKQKLNPNLGFGFVGILGFLIGILPVINLYFIEIHNYENDRYGYFASIFVYLLISTIVLRFFKKVRYLALLLLLLAQIVVTCRQNNKIQFAGSMINSIVDSYTPNDTPTYIGSLPENHDGIYMFRDLTEKGDVTFETSLYWLQRKKIETPLFVLSQYNLKDASEHIKSSRLPDGRYQVYDVKSGSWLWRKSHGISSYENDFVKLDVGPAHYRARLKTKGPIRFLIPINGRLEEIQ